MANGKRTGLRYTGAEGVARQTNTRTKVDGELNLGVRDLNRLRTQADRIFHKFGGVKKLHQALQLIEKPRQLQAMYRWLYTKEKGGSDGLVPTQAMPDILTAARYLGIVLSSEDLDPRAIPIEMGVKKAKNNLTHDL